MKRFFQQFTLVGEITTVDLDKGGFSLRLLSGDVITAYLGTETSYQVLKNRSRQGPVTS